MAPRRRAADTCAMAQQHKEPRRPDARKAAHLPARGLHGVEKWRKRASALTAAGLKTVGERHGHSVGRVVDQKHRSRSSRLARKLSLNRTRSAFATASRRESRHISSSACNAKGWTMPRWASTHLANAVGALAISPPHQRCSGAVPGVGQVSATDVSPIHIRPQLFTSHYTPAFTLKVDAQTLTQRLPFAKRLSQIADRCPASRSECGLLKRAHGVQEGSEGFHSAEIYHSVNIWAIPFGVLPFGNGGKESAQ